MQIQMKIPQTTTFTSLSSSNSSTTTLSLLPKLSSLSLTPRPPPSTLIRMGGGPRTYPGGVSKWQWKRMQSKKAKQLLKARLSRERHIYEMRKRAELKAAIANLERPWEVVSDPSSNPSSSLFVVSADDQLKALADRFQKPGGFDLWSHHDGPQLFYNDDGEGLPSARFFPKGVVHSIKPYAGSVDEGSSRNRKVDGEPSQRHLSGMSKGSSNIRDGLNSGGEDGNCRGMKVVNGEEGRKRGKKLNGGLEEGSDRMKGNEIRGRKLRRGTRMRRNLGGENDDDGDVFDLSLQGDGRYGFSGQNDDNNNNNPV